MAFPFMDMFMPGAQPAPGQAPAPQGGGFMSGFSNALTNNQATLLTLAGNMMSQGQQSPFANVAQAAMADQQRLKLLKSEQEKEAQKRALAEYLQSQGMDPKIAGAIGTDNASELAMKTYLNRITPKKPEYKEVGDALVQINPDGTVKEAYKNSAPTSLLKELAAAGLQPGTPEYQQAILDANKRGGVTVNNQMESSYDKQMGEANVKAFSEAQQEGQKAQESVARLNRMETLLQDPSLYTGTGGRIVLEGKRMAALLTGNKEMAAAAEELQAHSAKDVLEGLGGGLGAQISNADREFVGRIAPGLANTREGNLKLIEYRRRVVQRQAETAQLAREYAIKNGGRFDMLGFQQALKSYADANPLFPEGQKQQEAPAQGAAPAPSSAPATGAPTREQLLEEARRRGLLR